MGAYQFVAVDTGGKEHRGVLEGDTPRHVRQLLRDKQLLPVEVAEVEARERKTRRQVSFRRGISGLDLALLTRQLATLVKAGLPLEEALLAVSEHTEKPRLKSENRLAKLPLVRGVVRLGEALLVVPVVRRGMPEARLAFEEGPVGVAAVGSLALAAVARRRLPSVLAQEAVGAPALIRPRRAEASAAEMLAPPPR